MRQQFIGDHGFVLTTGGGTNDGYFEDEGSISGAAFVHLIDGTEGYTETLTVTTPGSETILCYMAVIEGVATSASGTDWTFAEDTTGAGPSVSGWAAQNEIGYSVGIDTAAITAGSYTNRASLASGGVALRVQQGDLTGGFNPGAFTMTGTSKHSFTIAGRYTDPGWGSIPLGRGVYHDGPWDGGNQYHPVILGTATATVSAGIGLITVTADGTTVSMVLISDAPDSLNGEPWGPWADGAAKLRYKWKVSALGDVGDGAANLLDFLVITKDWRGRFRYNLGDALTYVYQSGGDERGIVVLQTASAVASDFIPLTLVADTYYWTEMDFRDTRVRMRHYADGDTAPTAWDIDVAKIDEDLGESDVKQLWIDVSANSGMTFSFDEAYAQIGVPGSTEEPGHDDAFRGDGVTTTFTWRPWTGPIWLYIDGILTEPASTDPVLGTFTFSRAPAVDAYIIPLATTA